MNLLQLCDYHYDEYAKNTILSFFKDITQFANVMNINLDLTINFYSKKPVFTWMKNEK